MTQGRKPLTQADLMQFTGTETWYRHPLVKTVLCTEGAQYVAETGGAYWLLDEIAFAQKSVQAVSAEDFQFWKLTVKPDQTATLVCEDGDGHRVYTKALTYTDFPLPDIAFYFTNDVILLPGEY